MPWAKRTSRPVPSSGSPSATLEINDYSLGYNSFLSNDKFPLKNGGANYFRLAQDARIITLGEYETRRGFDFYSNGAGETQDQSITSTTGADDAEFGEITWLAQKWTCGTSGLLSKLELNLKNTQDALGTVIVEHWTDDGGEPGEMVARSSIAASDVDSTYGYLTARFASMPSVTSATSYWIVVYIQSVGANSYEWSSTTSATTAMSSSDSGTTWSSESFALNFKQHYMPEGEVKGLARLMKSDGSKVTIYAHKTSVYTVSDVNGALTAIKTGLNVAATNYEFILVNDIIYYVNGFDGLRKWDFTTESQVKSDNYTHMALHKGLLFLVPKDDPTKCVFSNFADYETFTSTDFIYVPAPKTGDHISALVSLNGYLIFFTTDNKFILTGDDNATFALEEAPDQNGTYSQHTVSKDDNFVYYLCDTGVYRSNGSEPTLMSKSNYQEILAHPNKSKACIVVTDGKLYLWLPAAGSSFNNVCYVWNLKLDSSGTLESYDTGAFVSRAIHTPHDSGSLLVGSSLAGQIYWQELESNDYTNLGGDINYELDTHYLGFNSPSVLKEVRFWQPRFKAQSGNYPISCEYATDLRGNWQSHAQPSVQGAGSIWGSGITWGNFTWGTTAETQQHLYIPGEYRRIAVRYKHHATRQPQCFLGHTFVVQTRRMR